jgi:hypothetical protein
MITEWDMRLRARSHRVATARVFMEIGKASLGAHTVSRIGRIPRLGKALFGNYFKNSHMLRIIVVTARRIG